MNIIEKEYKIDESMHYLMEVEDEVLGYFKDKAALDEAYNSGELSTSQKEQNTIQLNEVTEKFCMETVYKTVTEHKFYDKMTRDWYQDAKANMQKLKDTIVYCDGVNRSELRKLLKQQEQIVRDYDRGTEENPSDFAKRLNRILQTVEKNNLKKQCDDFFNSQQPKQSDDSNDSKESNSEEACSDEDWFWGLC